MYFSKEDTILLFSSNQEKLFVTPEYVQIVTASKTTRFDLSKDLYFHLTYLSIAEGDIVFPKSFNISNEDNTKIFFYLDWLGEHDFEGDFCVLDDSIYLKANGFYFLIYFFLCFYKESVKVGLSIPVVDIAKYSGRYKLTYLIFKLWQHKDLSNVLCCKEGKGVWHLPELERLRKASNGVS